MGAVPAWMPDEFKQIWEIAAPHTMTSPERGHALWLAVLHILDAELPGAFVECGVWRGGSAVIIALALKQRGIKRPIILFDTFAGMTEAGPEDVDYHGDHADVLLAGGKGERVAELVAARAPLEHVREVMAATGYDQRFVRMVAGDVRVTLPQTQTLRIALLHLDTDFYDSTHASLVQLYPRVVEGGLVIVDDYGHWRGARRAVDNYFAEAGMKRPMLWPIDYTGRAFAKPDKQGRIDIERYDYVPPGLEDPALVSLFPEAEPLNPWNVKWPHLRPAAPHIFRTDRRDPNRYVTGYASYEEAVVLYNLARPFAGRRGLEIGTHFGWTGAHLLAAGLEMDFVDPAIADPARTAALVETFDQIAPGRYRLTALPSPQAIEVVRAQGDGGPFAFAFIDGDHAGEAPANDARAVLPHLADEAVVVFHDLTSPDVAAGLAVFAAAGFSIRLVNTMQILGVATRGAVAPLRHVPDPNVPAVLPPHLAKMPRAGE